MGGEISSIRSQFKTTPFQLVPVCHTVLLSEFKMISMTDLPDIVSHKHTSSCPIDSMPKFINVLLTVITDDFKIASVFLSFSKILVICRLFHPVEGNNVFDKFQSSYQRNHSNETELFQINNILISWTKVNSVLWDISAAFDSTDHALLIDRWQSWFAITLTLLIKLLRQILQSS